MRHLARVQPASVHGRTARVELTHFCTHCAAVYDAASSRIRVCPQCGLGVILTCSSATLDAPGAAFLVVPADLNVSAASRPAEDMLAAPDGVYGRPLASLLTSPLGAGEMGQGVTPGGNTPELFQNNFSKAQSLAIIPLWQIRQ